MEGCDSTNKAEIDMSSPFRSVKEAVVLFGERVLVGEVYANKHKEMKDGANEYEYELQVTKQSLEKAREESKCMAKYLSSLQQELEHTKRELKKLKTRVTDTSSSGYDGEEDLKFIQDDDDDDSSDDSVEHVKMETTYSSSEHGKMEYQKIKKYVTFANPPSLARAIHVQPSSSEARVLERNTSTKKKIKQLVPFFLGIFSKKKACSGVEPA